MASGPITSWKIDGETVEKMSDFIFLGSKITADGDCSHEIKRRLLLGRKVMTNLDSMLQSRDITLPTKVHIVKTVIFEIASNYCILDSFVDHDGYSILEIDWETVETVSDFILGGSKITADGDCSHEIK